MKRGIFFLLILVVSGFVHTSYAMDVEPEELQVDEFSKRLHICLFGGVKKSIAGLNKRFWVDSRIYAYKFEQNDTCKYLRRAFVWYQLTDEGIQTVENYMKDQEYAWFVLERQEQSIKNILFDRGYIPISPHPMKLTKFSFKDLPERHYLEKMSFEEDQNIKMVSNDGSDQNFVNLWATTHYKACYGGTEYGAIFYQHINQIIDLFRNRARLIFYIGYRDDKPVSTCMMVIKKSSKTSTLRAYLGYLTPENKQDDLWTMDHVLFVHAMRDAQIMNCSELWMLEVSAYGANLPGRSAMNVLVYVKPTNPSKPETTDIETTGPIDDLVESVTGFFKGLFNNKT